MSVPLRPLDFFDLIAAWDDGATPWCFHEAGDASVTLFGWDGALELTATGDTRFAQIDARWRTLVRDAVTARNRRASSAASGSIRMAHAARTGRRFPTRA